MGDPTVRNPGQRFRNPAAMSPSAPTPGSQLPATPLGSPPAPKLQRYQTGSRPLIALVVVALVAVIAGLVYFGTRPAKNDPDTPSGTPTPSQTHTPPPGGLGVEFQSSADNVSGYWEILGWEWDSKGVSVTMRITLDKGTSMQFGWFALDNTNAEYWYPDKNRSTIATGTVRYKTPATGTVYFEVPRGKLTVYLCDSWGQHLTGLVVPE